MARLRENLPPCHVRLSLLNWAPVRPTLDARLQRAAHLDTFRHVGLTRVARLSISSATPEFSPRRETSDGTARRGARGLPRCAFAFSLPPLATGENLEEDRCPAFLRQIGPIQRREAPVEFLAERSIISGAMLPPLTFSRSSCEGSTIADTRNLVV